MNITVDRAKFLDAIAPSAIISERNSTLEMLSHVRLRAASGVLEVVTTSLQSWSITRTDYTSKTKKSASVDVAVPSKQLRAMAASMPGREMQLDFGTQLVLACGSIRYKLPSVDGKNFPSTPEVKSEPAKLPSAGILGALELALPYASLDETSVHINSIAIVPADGGVNVQATSGYTAFTDYVACDWGSSEVWMVPRLQASAMVSLLPRAENVEIRRRYYLAEATAGSMRLIVHLADAVPPPVDRLMKDTDAAIKRRAEIKSAALTEALKRAAKGGGDAVSLTFAAGGVSLSSLDPKRGSEYHEDLPCDYQGDSFSIGLNRQYLQQAAATIDQESLTIGMSDDQLSPVLLQPGSSRRVIVMPMRI